MNGKNLINVIKFMMILLLIMNISGCERNLGVENNLEDQLEDCNVKIEELEQKIKELEIENKGYIQRVAELSAKDPNGLKIEEKRKALIERESNLKIREDKLSKREIVISEQEKSIRKDEKKLSVKRNEFVDTKQKDLESIGEANEMKRHVKKLEKEKSEADNRANNWLIWISILGLIVFISIISVVILSIKMKVKGQQIGHTFDMLNSIKLSNEDKRLLTSSLGKYD